jgi:hopene-associated glycosyltransferase HpnB
MAGALSAASWIYFLAGRGRFWKVRDDAHSCPIPPPARRVAVVIPARNEAGVISEAVASLLAQDYAREPAVFVVDDHSSDATAQVARCLKRVTVLHASRLPQGWTGKLWALSEGVKRASKLRPEFFLFTDADIVHAGDNLSQLIARAESGRYDLVSLMVNLRCQSLAERAVIPAFVYFFFSMYPPSWIARPDKSTAGAAGGCILIRREMLSRMGGLQAISGELIDDCALARQVKRKGGRVWLGLTSATRSVREYGTFRDIEKMVSRTAYTQLNHSPLLLVGTLAGLALVFLTPPILIVTGDRLVVGLGLLAWTMMAISFLPILRFYDRSPIWAIALPFIAVLYMSATLHSAGLHYTGRGGEWKGRVRET